MKRLVKPLSSSPSLPFQQHQHEETEEEVQLFTRGEVGEFVDLEAAFPEGGLFGEAHGGGSVGTGRAVAGVAEVAAQEADDGDFTEEGIDDLGPGVLLADGEVGGVVAGIEGFVVGFPNGAPAAAADGADGGAVGVGGMVAGGPVDDLVGLDLGEEGGAGLVGEDLDVLAELEKLLLGVEDDPAVGVGDGGLAGEGEDLEAQCQRILDAGELAADVVLRHGRRDGGGGWGVGVVGHAVAPVRAAAISTESRGGCQGVRRAAAARFLEAGVFPEGEG